MKRWWVRPIVLFGLLVIAVAFTWQQPVSASDPFQLPTVAIATVTGSPSGPMVVMNGNEPQANLRAGPGSNYERVGILLQGQRLPAKGRSPHGEWIQVEYTGAPGNTAWIYSYLVNIDPSSANLPIVEPPPTPTPVTTATIDPTLAARFVITVEPSRLPTFTEPPPLAIPTFTAESAPSVGAVPMGFIVLGLAALGLFIGMIAFSQRG